MNKTVSIKFFRLAICLLFAYYITACEKNGNVAPGLSVEVDEINTYPGDEVTVAGMASAINGIRTIEITCANWNISKVYDLVGQKPKVFNYTYRLEVPTDIGNQFSETLVISITDVDNNVTRKEIPIKFLPDSKAPVFTAKPPTPIPVNFDVTTGEGSYLLNITAEDDRELSNLTIEIPGIGFEKEIAMSGKVQSITENIVFLTVGTFQGIVTAEDKTGNKGILNIEFVVIPTEDEDPINDYAQMYVINTDESPVEYILGYYKYMTRTDAYKYSAKFYAPKNNTKIAFVSTQSITGDYFGVSPYVSTKLMNKNGYVQPIVIAQKGYYTVEIDIHNKLYSITAYSPNAPSYTGAVNITGVGFSFADWTMSPDMTPMDNNYRYTVDVGVVLDITQTITFCFTNASWAPQWKPDGNGGAPTSVIQLTGWSERNSGGNFEDYFQGPGNYTFSFDFETMWATVSAKH